MITKNRIVIIFLISLSVQVIFLTVLFAKKFIDYKKFDVKIIFQSLWQNQTPSLKTSIRDEVHTILLFIGIFSAPVHFDRRYAVRETWMTQCRRSKKAICWFITDGQDTTGRPLKDVVRMKLENESRLHSDLLFAQSPGGTNFARRYLWTAQWARKRYNFQYLLRVDDDYFICFEKLLLELEFHRPKQKFRWGWLHCSIRDAVIIDDGFVIVTKDIIEYVFSKLNTTLLCLPYGDQAMGMWLNDFQNLQTFGDNKRIFHLGFDSKEKAVKRREICNTTLAIHQSYPEEMKIYWNVYLKEKNNTYNVPPIEFPCNLPEHVNYRTFDSTWLAEPELCKDNPVWNHGERFIGKGGKLFVII